MPGVIIDDIEDWADFAQDIQFKKLVMSVAIPADVLGLKERSLVRPGASLELMGLPSPGFPVLLSSKFFCSFPDGG